MEETIVIRVPHFFNHPIYFPFMSQAVFEIMKDAYAHHEETAIVPKADFEFMIQEYMNTLWN